MDSAQGINDELLKDIIKDIIEMAMAKRNERWTGVPIVLKPGKQVEAKRRERWNNPPTLEQIKALNKDKGKTAEKSKTKKNGKTKAKGSEHA